MGCRHRKTWIVSGGYLEWCYQCGAIRGLRPVGGDRIALEYRWKRWIKPTGPGGANPWDKVKEIPKETL